MRSSPHASYFSDAVGRVVGPYLSEQGFSRESVTPTRVTYRRDATLVSLAYYVEDLPSPWVAVDVGLRADDGSYRLAGLWRALGNDEPARAYTKWTFEGSASLTHVLERVVAEVLRVHGPRVWKSPEVLERLLAAQEDDAETRYLEDVHHRDLLQARRAYQEGRFQEAIDKYVLLDSASLSAADRRMLYEARQRAF